MIFDHRRLNLLMIDRIVRESERNSAYYFAAFRITYDPLFLFEFYKGFGYKVGISILIDCKIMTSQAC